MKARIAILVPVLAAVAAIFLARTLPAQRVYDVVILNGRVMDPASGADRVENVGIDGGRIVTLTASPIRGRREIDARGLVVAPGFIDILGPVRADRESHLHKATDGVTTSIGMHGGPVDVAKYSQEMAAASPIVNYAKSVGHPELRQGVGATDRYKPATPEQTERMAAIAAKAIRDGAAGIGFGVNYTPGASYEEIFAMFAAGAKQKVPCHLHARYKGNTFPETMSLAAMEIIAIAAATGEQAQVAHLISSTVGSAPLCIKLLEGASSRGVDVGFDFHVWTRNETWLKSALYDEGWQERFGGIDYADVYVSATQERLTKARFDELRKQPQDTLVQTEFIKESEIEMALRSPMSIVSSDGDGLNNGKGHPRSVGNFARLLGRYVREKQTLSLMDALRKITVLPAKRMEKALPQMVHKGRLQEGADADITVFDAKTVGERATYLNPGLPSEGIHYVLVNGTLVIDGTKPVPNATPGRWLRHPA